MSGKERPTPGFTESAGQRFIFASFRLEPDGTLFRGQAQVHLPPKELAALRCLLEHHGQVVSPAQLRQAVWGGVYVTADSIPKCLSSLRALLGEEELIQTVYKRGYRLVCEVQRQDAGSRTPPRLVILPFTTGYSVPEYLGPAVAEETIARLCNARPALFTMVARDSVFTLAQRGLDAVRIGETLKAALVLTGALAALPLHYRLRVEMLRTADGTQLWVEDIFVPRNRAAGLETELASRLTHRLAAGLSLSAAAEEEQPSTAQHQEAYEIYQRARYEWQTLERHRMQDGLRHLTRSAELDPSLIAAKIELAHLCVTQAFYGFMSPAVSANLVRRTAESIPDFSQGLETLLPALGWVSFHAEHNLPAANRAFSRSAHLPHDPWTSRVRAMFWLSRGNFAEGIALLRGALREDPYSPWLHARLAWALHLAEEARESVAQIEQALHLFPEHEGTCLYGSIILAFNGEPERGVKLAAGMARRLPYFDLATAVHAYALACAGHQDQARTILERLQWMSRERFVLKSFMPAVCVALGDLDGALAELGAAEQDRCPWFFQMLADPRLKPLHGLSEFTRMKQILADMEAAAARMQAGEN